MRTLTRPELTAALAARQLLLVRQPLSVAAAIARLTPLQGQHSPAPYVALAARLEDFSLAKLQAAITRRTVVKATLMRNTLHLAAAAEYPAYAQLSRQARMRAWRRRYAHLDETRVVSELGAWLREPRTTSEIRERVGGYEGVAADPWTPVAFARSVLPLVALPPAGFWRERQRASYVVDSRPLPDPVAAATVVARRYLAAFGPATRRDIAAWAGVAQHDFDSALAALPIVSYRNEHGQELLDLPGMPLPPASAPLPVRLLARWDQPLLAYADRERIIPAAVQPLKLTLSGDATVTVEGRVAGSWQLRRGRRSVEVGVVPHVEIARAAAAEVRAEATRTARFCEPDAGSVSVVGV